MAAVFGGEFGNKGRLPQGGEVVAIAYGGQTAIQGIDKNNASGVIDNQIVGVDFPGQVAEAGDVEAIVPAIEFSGIQAIRQLPNLVPGAENQSVWGRPQPHRSIEGSHYRRQPTFRLDTQQNQPIGLVGGERKANLLLDEPV